METLRQKARVLSLAWLHQIADAAIDTHSIPVVQQYIRDLEQAIADLREAQAENDGAISGLNRQISQLHQQETVFTTPYLRCTAPLLERRILTTSLHATRAMLTSLMLVYRRKWKQLRLNQIPLLMSWHKLQYDSGVLLAKHVLVFLPLEVQ